MASWSPRAPWATAGVRARTTLVAMVVVGVVLAAGFVLLADRTRARLEDSITASAETRALDVAALAEAGALPGTILSSGGEQHVQVVEAGMVVAGTFAMDLVPPLTTLELAAGTTAVIDLPEAVFDDIERTTGLIEDEGPYVVAGRGYRSGDVDGVVLVAGSIDAAASAVNALQPLLWIGWPVTLVAVGLTVWMLTGWALRPVHAMSEEAGLISATALDRRVPVPRAEDEVQELALTLNLMLSRLESSAMAQRRFVSDASHELKTPLATLRTMIEVASGDPGSGDRDSLLVGLEGELSRLDGLVADLLVLARFDEQVAPEFEGDVDLDQVLGRVSEHVARLNPGLGIDRSGIEAARVAGNAGALERLFTHLGANAARYAAGRVSFGCRVAGERVVARVADDGPGVPMSDRERIFERFVRLDPARDRPGGGTGLGLAVARAIARSHGGDVRVVGPTDGATFEVTLPAREHIRFSGRS